MSGFSPLLRALARRLRRQDGVSVVSSDPEEEAFLDEWMKRHAGTLNHLVAPVALVLLAASIAAILALSPEKTRLIQAATHGLALLLMATWRFAMVRHKVHLRPLILALCLTMSIGYALAMAACFTPPVSLADAVFLTVLYVGIVIFSIILCPFTGPVVLACATLYFGLGLWAWRGITEVPTVDWAIILGGLIIYSLVVFYGRIGRLRREGRAEFKTRRLLTQNERLRMAAVEKELDLAREIQESFMPPARLAYLDLEATFYQMKHDVLGGDWMAARLLPTGEFAIVVADATGKGVSAALVIHAVQSLWANSLDQEPFEPLAWLASVNRTLVALGQRTVHSMTLGLLIVGQRRLRYYSAGHLPLILLKGSREDASLSLVLARGNILGLWPTLHLEPREVTLEEGQRYSILLGTDGVFDRGLKTKKKQILAMLDAIERQGSQALEACPALDDKLLVWVRQAA